MMPTPSPAKNLRGVNNFHVNRGRDTHLPATRVGIWDAIVCNNTPTQNIATAMIKDIRRPILSPIGAAKRAPKNVPALNIATMRDDSSGVTFGLWSLSMNPVLNCFRKAFMAKIPEMVLGVHQSLDSSSRRELLTLYHSQRATLRLRRTTQP